MNKEPITIKMKDERTPEEVMKNKAKIEHQDAEEELIECEGCNKEFKEDEVHELRNIDGEVEHEHLCEKCEDMYRSEDEPIATIFYNDDETPHEIATYRDDTEGDFKANWVGQGYRGCYTVTSEKWAHMHDDCILSYSEDAEELKKFDDAFRAALREQDIEYARVFSRTSNVFSQGYDFFCEKGKEFEAGAIRVILALRYRDTERFNATALTGKNPNTFDDQDKMFIKAVKLLEDGLTPEECVKRVTEEK